MAGTVLNRPASKKRLIMSTAETSLREAFKRGYRVDKSGALFNPEGKIVQGWISEKGYRLFGFRVNGETRNVPVHRLQAIQKYGERIFEEGMVIRHYNGNSQDNSFENLLIGTHSQNRFDIPKEKRQSMSRYATSFWKKHDHEEIKSYFKVHGFSEAMKKYNISSKGTMSYIINH